MKENKKQKILILAGSGTGKSTAAESCKNVVDIDTIDYMFHIDKKRYGNPSGEELKNLVNNWIVNPANFPGIKMEKVFGSIKFFLAVKKALKNNIVLIPLIPETFTGMKSVFKKARKIVVIPEKENFSEYTERFAARGNDDNFIKVREADHKKIWELLENEKAYEVIVLKKGEYLADALKSIFAEA